MRRACCSSLLATWLVTAPALGDVFSSEFFSDPVAEGWQPALQHCDPITWTEGGWYYQELDEDACPGPGSGAQDAFVRSVQEFNGHPLWFVEHRVLTTGDRSEIPGAAPTVLAAGNAFGVGYNVTVACDQLKLLRDTDVPVLFFDVQPGIPHVIRLELDNGAPAIYRWYIDGLLADEGLAEGPFPAADARVTWLGGSWQLPTLNAWDYIRYGDIPADGSGDFDTSGTIDTRDFYFFGEYFSGEAIDAGPGGRWVDFDGDADVDCSDWEAFRASWTDTAHDPPVFIPCFEGEIPALSEWGVGVMLLLVLTTATMVFGGWTRDGSSSPTARDVRAG